MGGLASSISPGCCYKEGADERCPIFSLPGSPQVPKLECGCPEREVPGQSQIECEIVGCVWKKQQCTRPEETACCPFCSGCNTKLSAVAGPADAHTNAPATPADGTNILQPQQ